MERTDRVSELWLFLDHIKKRRGPISPLDGGTFQTRQINGSSNGFSYNLQTSSQWSVVIGESAIAKRFCCCSQHTRTASSQPQYSKFDDDAVIGIFARLVNALSKLGIFCAIYKF